MKAGRGKGIVLIVNPRTIEATTYISILTVYFITTIQTNFSYLIFSNELVLYHKTLNFP